MTKVQQQQAPTELPPGVHAGPLVPRLAAAVIDLVVPAAAATVVVRAALVSEGAGRIAAVVLGLVVILGWALLVWWMFAARAAGPGMRVAKLQLVGFSDGRPIGWGRFLLRQLLLLFLCLTVIGIVIVVVRLARQRDHRGWHDNVADSVVIKQRALAPPRPKPGRSRSASPAPPANIAADETSSAPVPGASGDTAPLRPTPATSAGPQQPEVPPAIAPAEEPAAVPAPAADESTVVEQPAVTTYMTDAPPQVGSDSPAAPAPVDDRSPGMGGEPAPVETEPSPAAREPVQPRVESWIAVLDDGREVEVSGLVVLGRNPVGRPGEEDAVLVKIQDASRTVSKSHLALGLNGTGLHVVDRGSTNGTTVTTADGDARRLQPDDRMRVGEGSIVSFGDHWLEVRRR